MDNITNVQVRWFMKLLGPRVAVLSRPYQQLIAETRFYHASHTPKEGAVLLLVRSLCHAIIEGNSS